MNEFKEVDFGEHFGFSELYEWGEDNPIDYQQNQIKNNKKPTVIYQAKLVQFSEQYPYTVIRARNTKNIIGISTNNSGYSASNPNEWPYKYIINEYGDLYLYNKDIGTGKKIYDSINEMSIMQTSKKSIIVPLENPDYDKEQQYVQRKNRGEWCNTIILGKAIIEDNGKCVPGEYCTLYKGDNSDLYGTVEPATKDDTFKLYVMQRLSDHTIIVFFVPQIYSLVK